VGHGTKTPGGLDVVDLEVFMHDYMDQVSMTNSGLRAAVGFRFLEDAKRDEEFYRNIEEVVQKYYNTPFEKDPINMAKSEINCCNCVPLPCYCWCRPKPDTTSLFCSEFVAEAYKAAGLLPSRIISTDVIPPKLDTTRDVHLLNGVTLSKEYVVFGPRNAEERLQMGYPPSEAASSSDASKKLQVSTSLGPGGFYNVDVSQPIPLKL